MSVFSRRSKAGDAAPAWSREEGILAGRFLPGSVREGQDLYYFPATGYWDTVPPSVSGIGLLWFAIEHEMRSHRIETTAAWIRFVRVAGLALNARQPLPPPPSPFGTPEPAVQEEAVPEAPPEPERPTWTLAEGDDEPMPRATPPAPVGQAVPAAPEYAEPEATGDPAGQCPRVPAPEAAGGPAPAPGSPIVWAAGPSGEPMEFLAGDDVMATPDHPPVTVSSETLLTMGLRGVPEPAAPEGPPPAEAAAFTSRPAAATSEPVPATPPAAGPAALPSRNPIPPEGEA